MDEAGFLPAKEPEKESDSDETSERSTIRETKLAALQDKLRELLENEDYEQAAKIRDEINKLGGSSN